MPLVNVKDMMGKALEGHYSVGQFNINNLEWTKQILLAAEEAKSPVILGVSWQLKPPHMSFRETKENLLVLTLSSEVE